jgi:hypothetical protein
MRYKRKYKIVGAERTRAPEKARASGEIGREQGKRTDSMLRSWPEVSTQTASQRTRGGSKLNGDRVHHHR